MVEVLQRQPVAMKQLFLITDGQANGWKQLAETRTLFDSTRDVHARFVLLGESEQHNLGVTALRMASALAPVNEPVRFEIEVANYGVAEAKNVQVGLAIDEDPPGDDATIDAIPAGESKTISLYATFREAGYHSVVARLPADRNPADDQRALAVRAIGEINVLLVDGDPGIEPRESAVFYLRNALTPVPPELREKYFIKTRTISPAELPSVKLGDYEAVVLANVADVPEAVLTGLERYLRAGGGLIVFPGGKINAKFYNEKMFTERAFLPAAFGDPHGNAGAAGAIFHAAGEGLRSPHRLHLARPGGGQSRDRPFLSRLHSRNRRRPPATRAEAGPPALVLSYADGRPAVMERTWGFGRVVQFSSTANAAWNDLCIRPIFLPLIHRTLGALVTRQEENLNLRVGAPLRAIVDAELIGKDVMIIKPPARQEGRGWPPARDRVREWRAAAAIRRHGNGRRLRSAAGRRRDSLAALRHAGRPRGIQSAGAFRAGLENLRRRGAGLSLVAGHQPARPIAEGTHRATNSGWRSCCSRWSRRWRKRCSGINGAAPDEFSELLLKSLRGEDRERGARRGRATGLAK